MRTVSVAKKPSGSGAKPRRCAAGVAVSRAPTVTAPSAANVSGRLGWLRRNGTRRVRTAKMIRPGWPGTQRTSPYGTRPARVRYPQSKIELSGPKVSMNRRRRGMPRQVAVRSGGHSRLLCPG
jgi:hypothetical protein